MLWLSELILQHPELTQFDQLAREVTTSARAGEMFFRADVKPQYPDTPENWEDRLEAAFSQLS